MNRYFFSKIFFDDLFFIAVCLLAFTVPISTSGNGLIVIFAAVLLLFALFNGYLDYDKLKHPLIISLLMFFMLHLFGLLYTENVKAGATILQKKLTFLILPLFFSIKVNFTRSRVNKIILFYLASLVLAGLILLFFAIYRTISSGGFKSINSYTLIEENHFFYHTYSELLGHAIYYGVFYTVGIGMLIYLLKINFRYKNLLYVILLFFIFQIILLTPRIAIFYLAIIGIPLLILYFYGLKVSFKKIVLIAFFYLSISFIAYQFQEVKNRIDDILNSSFTFVNDPEKNHEISLDGVEFRLAKWYFTYLTIKQKGNILYGVGTGDGQITLNEVYKENNFTIGYIDHYNPHNQFLSTLLDFGLIGLFSYLSIFVMSVFYGLKINNIILIYICLLIFSFSITESILTRQKGVLLITFFIPFSSMLSAKPDRKSISIRP